MKRMVKFVFVMFCVLSSWHILSIRVPIVKRAAQCLAFFLQQLPITRKTKFLDKTIQLPVPFLNIERDCFTHSLKGNISFKRGFGQQPCCMAGTKYSFSYGGKMF